jgi:hypothetical protein
MLIYVKRHVSCINEGKDFKNLLLLFVLKFLNCKLCNSCMAGTILFYYMLICV